MKIQYVWFAILILAPIFFAGLAFTSVYAETGHPADHEAVYASDYVEPTCTEDGYYYRRCVYPIGIDDDGGIIYCGYVDPEYYMEGEPALGHNWQTVEIDASCWHYEGFYKYCDRCGLEQSPVYYSDDPDSEYYKDDLMYTEHSVWVYPDEKNVEPTCTEGGHVYRYCEICMEAVEAGLLSKEAAAIEDYDVAPLGHDYVYDYEEKNESGESIRHYKCSRCGDTGYSVNLGIVSNETASSLLELFDKYWYWIWILLGSFIIIWGIYIGIRYATAQTDDDAAYARTSLKEFFIGILVIAVLCVGVPYLIWGVALWIG